MGYFIDCGCATMNKHGEELCGDCVQVISIGEDRVLVLADGMGSGVKANILSTMTSRILTTMIAEGANIEECVRTIMEALPVCRERGMNYCTFTIVYIRPTGTGIIYEYDNPGVILWKGGKCCDPESTQIQIEGKTLNRSEFRLRSGDAIVVMSDGVLFAGPNEVMNYDWQRPQIMQYLERSIRPGMSAMALSALLAGACMDLYCGVPGDDTTVAVVSLKRPHAVSVLIGPPVDRNREMEHVHHFMEEGDSHIVCGGTTSELVATYLDKELVLQPTTGFRTVPPYSTLEGIELVTEGALTIDYVVKLAQRHLDPWALGLKRYNGNNGAEKMAELLFEKATDITMFIGKTVNNAHAGTVADSGRKRKNVEKLCQLLRDMGKNVVEIYH